jgi:hypothetical protein
MTTTPNLETVTRASDVQRALETVRWLWVGCGLVSAAALAIAGTLSVLDPQEVTWVVWLRGTVVAAASFILAAVTTVAARGSRAAYVRLRWISILAPIGIGAIVLAPDAGYPLWMKIEQATIGVLIIIIAVRLNRQPVRQAFMINRPRAKGQ